MSHSILAELSKLGIAARNLCLDSRALQPGDVFVALPGARGDGRNFIEQALGRGAVAVLCSVDAPAADTCGRLPRTDVPLLVVENLAHKLGPLAHRVYHRPSEKLWLCGVTGTNGKTSVTHWLAQSLQALGKPCALVGTLGAGFPGALHNTANTTPDAIAVQRALAGLVKAGAKACAMEVSSIGLDAGRVNGLHFAAAVFTNLSRDHLDYHGTMAAYGAAKAALFHWPGLRHAIVNLDDPFGAQLEEELRGHKELSVIGYTLEDRPGGTLNLAARDLQLTAQGVAFTLDGVAIKAPVVGRFNAANVLAVIGALRAAGYELPAIARALETLTPPPGRMEKIGGDNTPLVVVDYAHTPDALEKTLAALREVAQGRGGQLHCVFGCGGERDPGKRPLMGKVAQTGADHVVVTSDNPRAENPQAIIDAIVAGMTPAATVRVIEDRSEAIATAVRRAAAQDVVLLAGKGHEPYQEVQGVRRPFADVEHARRALEDRGQGSGIGAPRGDDSPLPLQGGGREGDGGQESRNRNQESARANSLAYPVPENPIPSPTLPLKGRGTLAAPTEPARLQAHEAMMDFAQAAQMMGAQLRGAAGTFAAVFTDSRHIEAGGLFVALRGERFDGHDFVAEVLAQGAACALVDRTWATAHPEENRPLLVVDDTRRALGELARGWRRQFAIPLIAVTGSNGKTTVKEMLAAMLAAQFGEAARLATAGNFNNDIGLPLTLLRLRAHHRAAVIELGMNHPGETAQLAAICQPTVALINNAQREHQEFMQTVAAVAAEHGAVVTALPASGIAILNADDDFADTWRGLADKRAVRDFGLTHPAAVTATWNPEDAGIALQIATPEGRAKAHLAALGEHNVRNALCAVAAATAAGVTLENAARGLTHFRPVKGRLQALAGVQGGVLIDDSYNANPDSVRAAIDVLAQRPGQRILALGDMGEVGAKAGQFHDEIGGYAKSAGIEHLFTLGEHAAAAARNFGAGGQHFSDIETLIATLKNALAPGVTLLVKGSRFMHMERVVDALRGET